MNLPQWLLLVSVLLVVGVLLGVFARRTQLPLTVLLAVVGLAARALGAPLGMDSVLSGHSFEQVVIYLFLPALVFEAAVGLSTRAFFTNLLSILVLALPALTFAAGIVGAGLYLSLQIPLATALLFGVLISATDPVAVVGIFRRLGVPQRLLTLVEGESLLNDGVVVVLFNILLVVALGAPLDFGGGVVSFVKVFFGGLAIGAVLGLFVALLLPWLDRLSTAALSLALAYGSFVLTEHVLHFSGVMATVAAGVVVGALAPTRARADARESTESFWHTFAHVANVILFLLIGLAIDPQLLTDHAGAILLAVLLALAARAVAIVPLVYAVQWLARIPPMGRRNEAVLIWGGLRGGVALALALSLPDDLPQRELLVAMAGGVVLATLLLNATSIGWLVHRLGLDRPSRADHFLALGARLAGIEAARRQLRQLGLHETTIETNLDRLADAARRELRTIELDPREELHVALRRGLSVERQSYQRLSDAGLLPPPVARMLLHEVDDQIEEVSLDRLRLATRHRHRPLFDRVVEYTSAHLPPPAGDDPEELAYAEASARLLAARRTSEALELLEELPNMHTASIRDAKAIFLRWEHEAKTNLQQLERRQTFDREEMRRRQADMLAHVSSEDALRELAAVGLLPTAIADQAIELIAERVGAGPR